MSDDTERVQVLHVDDDREFATLTADVLEQESDRLAVTTATSAEEGLEHLGADSVDCIVSDYDMPGRDGLEFLEAVREEHPDLPFILFTGKGSEGTAAEALRAGATDYLRKSGGADQYALLANRVTNAAEQYDDQQQVRESEGRYQKLLEGSADYVHILDIDGTVRYVSPAIERVLGYPQEEVAGGNALEPLHPDDEAAVQDGLEEILGRPGSETTVEVRARHADGDWRWVEVRARNLLDDPAVEGVVANVRDVTDRRESEATAEWRRTIIESLGEGVYVLDGDHQFQFVSHRTDTAIVEDEWVGEPVSRLGESGILTTDEIEQVRTAVDDILDGARAEVTFEVEPTVPEETAAVELHLRKLTSPAGEDVVLGTTRDITDRRRRTSQLEALNDVARRMMIAGTHSAVAETAVGAVEDTLELNEAVVFRYDEDRDALVPVAGRVKTEALDGEIPTLERGAGVAWDVYESGEIAVLGDIAGTPAACDTELPVESAVVAPLGEHGVLAAGSTTTREFDDQTVSLAEILAANLTAAFTQVDRARELEEYERLVETMGDSVYSIDLDGGYIRVNGTFEELTGYSRDRLLEAGPELVLDGEGVEQFEAAIRRLLQADGGVESVETDLYTGYGEVVPIEANLTLLPAEEGGYRGTVGVIRDIAERRAREQELERYETIVTAFPDEVYTLDAQGYMTSVIPPAGWEQTTTGYAPDDLVGEHVSVVMPEEDVERGEELIEQLLASETERTVSFEMHTVRSDGEHVPHENHIALLPMEDGEFQGTVGVLRNVAERKERERELRRQNDRLEKFTSFLSHDLRNPLNVASARLNLARDDCASPHLDDVEDAHDRMGRLIEAVLTLAREGERPEEVEELSLKTVAEQCWAHVDTGEATLTVDTDRTVQAEETRVRQLLENLVRNAVEHGSTGSDPHAHYNTGEQDSVSGRSQASGDSEEGSRSGGRPQADDTVDRTEEEPVMVRIGDLPDGFYVEDDGPGIPPAEREEVFRAGYSTGEEGTGLGLNIVEEIAQAHGWAVDITESSEGGARFEFTDVS